MKQGVKSQGRAAIDQIIVCEAENQQHQDKVECFKLSRLNSVN